MYGKTPDDLRENSRSLIFQAIFTDDETHFGFVLQIQVFDHKYTADQASGLEGVVVWGNTSGL